jgi:hypothetical protein
MIRRTFLLTALFAAVSTTAAFGADTALLAMVPANATVAGGVAVARTAGSPFGQYVLAQMGQNNAHMQEFIDATGFDPRRDLQEVVFAAVGEQKGPGVVLARGVFNGPQIMSAIKAKTPAGGTLSTYGGVPLFEKNGHAVAIAEGWLAVAGESSMVRAALDRRSASGLASTVAQKAATTASKYDAWMVTSGVFVPPLPGKQGANPMGAGLQGVVETSGGLTFGAMVQFSGEALTRSDKDAQALVDVVKFLTGMIQMNTKNPETQKLQPIFDSLKVTAEGTSVRMSFSIPESDLEQLVRPRAGAKRTAAVRR